MTSDERPAWVQRVCQFRCVHLDDLTYRRDSVELTFIDGMAPDRDNPPPPVKVTVENVIELRAFSNGWIGRDEEVRLLEDVDASGEFHERNRAQNVVFRNLIGTDLGTIWGAHLREPPRLIQCETELCYFEILYGGRVYIA